MRRLVWRQCTWSTNLKLEAWGLTLSFFAAKHSQARAALRKTSGHIGRAVKVLQAADVSTSNLLCTLDDLLSCGNDGEGLKSSKFRACKLLRRTGKVLATRKGVKPL